MEASGPKIGRHQQPRPNFFSYYGYFRDIWEVARVGDGTRDHSYEWIKGRVLLVVTLARLGRTTLARVHSRERRSPLSAQKPICYGGLLVGGRRGWSQQLQDKTVFTPVVCDPSRPAISPRVHPGERREPSFSPFTPKAGMLYGGLLVGGRQGWSQQLQGQAVFTPCRL
jgi:hypothetical protein